MRFGGLRVRTRGRAFARDLWLVSTVFARDVFQSDPERGFVRTGRLGSVLLDSRTLFVESVVLGTSEVVLGGRMALWQADLAVLGKALCRAHKGTLRKHFCVCFEARRWS